MVSRKGITQQRGVSRKTLSTKFKPFFDSPISPEALWQILPPTIARNPKTKWVYGVDGKWLKRQGVILIHRDITHKENLYWSFWPSESSEAFNHDLKVLSTLLASSKSNPPIGVVSDWKMSIVTAVFSFFGPIPHQRCLVHAQRLAKQLLPANSPYLATRELREVALALGRVTTQEEKQRWQEKLIVWGQVHNSLLREKTLSPVGTRKKWWYTHGNLRRGFRLLTQNQDPLFVYLTNPLIPSSNNSLEGVNGQLKKRVGNHRGMKIGQKVSFINWYLVLDRATSREDLRQLWDYWRNEFLIGKTTRKVT